MTVSSSLDAEARERVGLVSLEVQSSSVPADDSWFKSRPWRIWIGTVAFVIVVVASAVLSAQKRQNHPSKVPTAPMKYQCATPESRLLTPLRRGISRQYPSIPFKVLDACGLAATCRELQPLGRSLAFVKTHKTGSSTIANFVNRIVESRDLTKMLPSGFTFLGWPGEFPGHKVLPCHDRYDAIGNHAIWNAKEYAKYLRDPMLAFTILRDPMSRIVSAFNYFNDFDSWRECIGFLNANKSRRVIKVVRYLNSNAFDLGWYERYGKALMLNNDFDHNADAIQSFIRQLDQEMDIVMISEHMTESLLLLSSALPNLNPQESILYNMKRNDAKRPILPNTTEIKELETFLYVDQLIYDHFKKKLLDWWEDNRKSVAISQKKAALECLQLWADNHTDPFHSLDNMEYSKRLWTNQRVACSTKYKPHHGIDRYF